MFERIKVDTKSYKETVANNRKDDARMLFAHNEKKRLQSALKADKQGKTLIILIDDFELRNNRRI